MAAFVYSDITESGINLKAKGEAGKEIRFTAISIGDGFLPEGQDIHTMTALVNQIMRLEVTGITLIGNGEVEVRAPFTNAELQVGFSYRELGLWAKDPDTGEERLYACANAGDRAEWIEASGGITVVEKIIRIITITGRATNVVAQLNSGIYITSADLDAHNLSPDSHPDLRQELSKKANIDEMANKVNTDGTSTMTGNLYFEGGNAISNDDEFLTLASKYGSAVVCQPDGTVALRTGGNSIHIEKTGPIGFSCSVAAPGEDNETDLGLSTRKFKDMYLINSPTIASDARIKKDIASLEEDDTTAFLSALNPVAYRLINGNSGRIHRGLLAQEVESAMEECGLSDMDFAGLIKSPIPNADGKGAEEVVYGLRMEEFIPVLIKGWQILYNKISALNKAMD